MPILSHSYTQDISFTRVAGEKSKSAKGKFAVRIIFAVSSIEYCCCLLSESYIGEGLGGASGHTVMIPLLSAKDKLRLLTEEIILMNLQKIQAHIR